MSKAHSQCGLVPPLHQLLRSALAKGARRAHVEEGVHLEAEQRMLIRRALEVEASVGLLREDLAERPEHMEQDVTGVGRPKFQS